MRRLILIGLVAIMTVPAVASQRVTVAQLERVLIADNATHRTDAQIAGQIRGFEMTERLTDAALNRLATTLNLQPRTALALQLLADQSAFLDPPANELPATAFPDAATQQHILDAARAYSVATWSRLPNFFVTRVTNRFDDTPQVLRKGDWPLREGLHLVGNASRQITFRDGKEVQDPTVNVASSNANSSGELGLRSWGEFGPALTVVLADMANHKVTFSHWEQAATGLVAVFHYEVPRDASHYAVTISYQSEQVTGSNQFIYSGRNRSPQPVAIIPGEQKLKTYSETPGYRGTIAIDPATGAVLRLTIEAQLSPGDPLLRAGTMIEYGPIRIGDRQFICPLRSVAVSAEPGSMSGCGGPKAMVLNGVGDDSVWESPLSQCDNESVLMINETTFSNYHRLGSSARILSSAAAAENTSTETPEPSSPPNSASHIATQTVAASGKPNMAASTSQTDGKAAELALGDQGANEKTIQSASISAATALPANPSATAQPPLGPGIPEVTLSAATGLPDETANVSSPAQGSFSIKVTSRLVDVGVVAYDKKGRPVSDLKVGDFELYDNGQKREIRYFSPVAVQAATIAAARQGAGESSQPEPEFSNRVQSDTNSANRAAEVSTTILLIDESHIAWSDMSNARGQILKFLRSLAPNERVGLYSMNGLGFHVMAEATQDHAALIACMQKFMPTAQSVSTAREEETRNRQHFDEVHNVADLNSVNGNHIDVPDAEQPNDPQLLTMGDDPLRASFLVLTDVARHLSAIPGQKKLVWISSDNIFADWRDQSVGIDKSPQVEKAWEMRTQEAMNDAHAAVYPFDVSQLEGSAINPDLQHQNVMLTPAAQEAASLGGGQTMSRNTTPGRVAAEMSQDIHPVQGQVRDVASDTGGEVIRRAGDLTAQLNKIVAAGDDTYMISFSPTGPPDDQYHTITVTPTGRRRLTLRYRTGYLFEKEPTTLKQRFQQAVWKPADVHEIGVAADVAATGAGTKVKINIATGDIGLEQQAGRWMDKLDIFFIERDDTGLHARVEGQTLGLRLKSSTYDRLMPVGVPFDHLVKMQPGMSSLRVLVVDENSGRMGSVTIPGVALKSGS